MSEMVAAHVYLIQIFPDFRSKKKTYLFNAIIH